MSEAQSGVDRLHDFGTWGEAISQKQQQLKEEVESWRKQGGAGADTSSQDATSQGFAFTNSHQGVNQFISS